jgi:ribosomal protein L12E/L44/L45/RPP1/RPP2
MRLIVYLIELIEMYGDIEVDGIQIQILVNQLHGVDMNGFSN